LEVGEEEEEEDVGGQRGRNPIGWRSVKMRKRDKALVATACPRERGSPYTYTWGDAGGCDQNEGVITPLFLIASSYIASITPSFRSHPHM